MSYTLALCYAQADPGATEYGFHSLQNRLCFTELLHGTHTSGKLDLQKDAKALGLKSPVATPAAVRAAYLRKARASHPDAGGTKQEFQNIQAAYERLGTQRRAQAAIDERYYSRRPNDVIDRINHRLSRPLGNLVPTRYKIAFRLGALFLVLGGAAISEEPRRKRRYT